MLVPRATYRLQFHEHFRLADALRLVPYLADLGISHVYASPLFQAVPHSRHGYDVCDFATLNPEIGTEAELAALVSALHARKMGLVLDIVPNHMGITTPDNGWWWDVLTHGERSKFAGYFDIDWLAGDSEWSGKVLLPVLGDNYETILGKGELKVLSEKNRLVLGYHEHRFPLAPASISRISAEPGELKKLNADFVTLDKLIRRQHYKLEFYQRGDLKLNYRRFFSISGLAGIRIEEAAVFEATHALIRRWLEKGWLDGLRVDHPDGLRDPEQYLQRLRSLAPNAWIVVEKILEPGEQLPPTWPVAGTTGYDFLGQLNGLFIDSSSEPASTEFYAKFSGETTDYAALVDDKKRAVLQTLFVTELNRLAKLLAVAATRHHLVGRFSTANLRAALTAIIVAFPVYRSYISGKNSLAMPADASLIQHAVQCARAESRTVPAAIFGLVESLFLQTPRDNMAADLVARFQQLTGPVMAKAVEDTAFYCFNRFSSLNEVGGDPEHFGLAVEKFHDDLRQRQKSWPHAQLASSTHDTKRSEDVRARLNVLSEIPELWFQTVRRWSGMNQCHRRTDFPDRNLEYLFYQTLVGAWPLSEERLQACLSKSAKEAKQYTTWTQPNAPYEQALQSFVSESLRDPQFTADVERFVRTVADAAAVNSLAQTLIKLTAPGVPDIYQGCELWDWSLVDPDNRRLVDFKLRQELIAEAGPLTAEQAWARRAGGLPKLWLIQKTLKLRERHPKFPDYDYESLVAHGSPAGHLVAFSRGGALLTIVPRFWMKLNHQWQDAALTLPAGAWRDEFTGKEYSGRFLAADGLQNFPVALLVRKEPS